MTSTTTAVQTPFAGKPKRRWRVVKWLAIAVAVIVALLALLIGALYATALTPAKPVGFQVVQVTSANKPAFQLGIWYPTTDASSTVWLGNFFAQLASNGAVKGQQLPLVVMSHGTGGGIVSHADLAMALAEAGFVVATPMHRDNYLDTSSVGTLDYIQGRSQQLSQTIDFMLQQWPAHTQLQPQKIAAYGFSIGAFSVLTAAGATPDLASVRTYCATHTEFACQLLQQSHSYLLDPVLPTGSVAFDKDPRIAAVVVAAPGLAFTMQSATSVAGITAPVQIWQGEQDTHVPLASNAQLLYAALGQRGQLQRVKDAAHLSFLAPCGLLRVPTLCEDPANFDRAAFHQQMNAAVVEFFQQQLPQ